ncbi:NADPH-dependent FMN reductase [Dapis sp. BLCC M172]|uniref:NADPH-dependent FMN reductase n=1 Tax=Dapis sp. BLCC M172 TaxID=2975281 RepID=UPI003CFA6CDA
MVKIVGIGGSLRSSSYSQQALEIVAERVEAIGAEVEILDLRTLKLPFCNGEKEPVASLGIPGNFLQKGSN